MPRPGTLTLAGGTAPEMTFDPAGNYLDGLREQISALHLEDVVDWQLDLPSAQIPSTIQAHHVMVLPYRESKNSASWGRCVAPVARCRGPMHAGAG